MDPLKSESMSIFEIQNNYRNEMSMWNIGFQIKQLDRVVKRNPPVVVWCSVLKLLMMTAPAKRCKCVHSKLFAVSQFVLLIFFFDWPSKTKQNETKKKERHMLE